MKKRAIVLAGIPATNRTLYRKMRFNVGDPAAVIDIVDADGRSNTTVMVRDIELERARRKARADRVVSPGDFAPKTGLSGDRETATAQAVAELLMREGVAAVTVDRSFPMIFAHHIEAVGLDIECDIELGVVDRRAKDADELNMLRDAQAVTEEAMSLACYMIGNAEVGTNGVLLVDGEVLTADRVRLAIDVFLLERGYANPPSIVAGGAEGADCHNAGHGPLHTGQPVIVDIFPCNRATLYNGDCTRTVVHGTVPAELEAMWRAVVEAKAAAIAAVRVGVTGEAVHQATVDALAQHGYAMERPGDGSGVKARMVHGTGHGVGLDVHEPPLLDRGGPALVAGDVLTIEPGLYQDGLGGVRVEDMVVVTNQGCENFNTLPEGLTWTG